MTTTSHNGRLCNQIIRNLAVSLIAEKHNLYVDYCNYNMIKSLGIELFKGANKHKKKILLNNDNYFEVLSKNIIDYNLQPNNDYFQSQEITDVLYKHLHSDKVKENIIRMNKFNDRYNNNNDLFIHIRLGDVIKYNPGLDYYMKCIKKINFDNLYIASDSLNHSMIKQIMETYTKATLVNYTEVPTIQFGSTCKHVILSHGSFSAVIGYLSFFSKVYYPEYKYMWHGDMFTNKGWNMIEY